MLRAVTIACVLASDLSMAVHNAAPAESEDTRAVRLLLEAGSTHSSNVGSGAASFVDVNPGASKTRCTNPEIASGDGKADLAACKARCAADPTCAFIVHWSDNGCQRFTSCTQGTHTWGVDSTVYQVRLPCVQPLWSSSPASGASVKIKADVECKSSDEWLGSFSTMEKCAAACAAKDGCEHFTRRTK